MSGGIYMAASGALAYEKRLQIISNNLANANTVGYKMDHGQFQSIDPADLPASFVPNSPEMTTSQAQSFWFQFSSYTDFTDGSLKNTGNDFDLALIGDGFFCVQKPDGVYYTRKGDFTLNEEGVLVTGNGYPVVGDGGEITVEGSGNPHQVKKLWNRRHSTKFNGVSYPVQKAAAAIFTEEGKKEVVEVIAYYMENARIMKLSLAASGYEVFGGENAPYIWVKTKNGMKSWEFFDKVLNEANVVGTPGSGFGPAGEGYFRFSAFADRENVLEAMERIGKLK